MTGVRDHGGGIDAAAAQWGGARENWLDLSTGINPIPYPVPTLPGTLWTALPDREAHQRLLAAARRFWSVPDTLDILAAPGASALIARLPALASVGHVSIPGPTYNEHEAAFRAAGWKVNAGGKCDSLVIVHPNNPDGKQWRTDEIINANLTIIDESFCDIAPADSLMSFASERPGTVILKSFGKFWGLAGLRLGFAIARPELIARLADMTGPWAVSGPALEIGTAALSDTGWVDETRRRLAQDAARLDEIVQRSGACLVGGTSLFRLYDTDNAKGFQERLAEARIWSRIFPYSDQWVRLGLPGREEDWARLEAALR